MPLSELRQAITKLILPTADLGMREQSVSPLQFPDDVPPVLALLGVQTPTGPRLVQARKDGAMWSSGRVYTLLHPLGAETATVTGPSIDTSPYDRLSVYADVQAITGTTPTFALQLQASFDNGLTWRSVAQNGTLSATGLQIIQAGFGAITPGGGVAAQTAGLGSLLPPLMRCNYIIGGTTPSVTFIAYMLAQ